MDLEDVSCPICDRMFTVSGDSVPRLIPDNGLCYCTKCIQQLIDESAGQDHFLCPEDPDTPIKRLEKAEDFMKNFQMIKMAQKFVKKQKEAEAASVSQVADPNAGNKFQAMGGRFDSRSSTLPKKQMGPGPGAAADMQRNMSVTGVQMNCLTNEQNQPPQALPTPLCPIHAKPMDVICVTCKERTCSNCALFGAHKGHDVRPESEVLDQINLRTECLMEMYQMMETAAQEKPNEMEVTSLNHNFKQKSDELRRQLKDKFKEMKNILVVQEHTTDAILTKNLQYIEKELKNLQSVDYRKFEEAEGWLKNAKVKLDNFQNNQNNPNYIAFEMMIGADANNQQDQNMNDDFLLVEDGNKNNDIIDSGEMIAGNIGKFKCIQPGVLASQLSKLTLIFKEDLIAGLNQVSKCIAIEGVEISNDELQLMIEGVIAQQEAQADAMGAMDDVKAMQMELGGGIGGGIGGGAGVGAGIAPKSNLMSQKTSPPVMNDLAGEMAKMKIDPMKNDIRATMGAPSLQPLQPQTQAIVNEPALNPSSSYAEPPMQPQNALPTEEPTTQGEELDGEFLQEIETYLKECMENNELSIDMSDTLIQDHGAKMVAAAASLCDQLQELRLQQCGITDDGAIELFNELKVLKQLQVIDISFNPITEKSLDALTDLLNSNQNLVVNMRMNSVRTRFAARKMQHFEQQGRLNIQNQ